MLIKAGVPSGALRVLLLSLSDVEHPARMEETHVLLVLITSEGRFVLDNLFYESMVKLEDALSLYSARHYTPFLVQDSNGRFLKYSWYDEYGDLPFTLDHPEVWKLVTGPKQKYVPPAQKNSYIRKTLATP